MSAQFSEDSGSGNKLCFPLMGRPPRCKDGGADPQGWGCGVNDITSVPGPPRCGNSGACAPYQGQGQSSWKRFHLCRPQGGGHPQVHRDLGAGQGGTEDQKQVTCPDFTRSSCQPQGVTGPG